MEIVIEKKCEQHFNLLKKYFDVYFDLEKFLKKDKYMSFCLRSDNELCGISLVHSIITPKGKNIFKVIYTVIDKEHRGNGYNNLLLNNIYDYAQNNNVKYILANIRESNVSSVKSFFKNGYRISNVLTEPYKNKEKKIRVVKFINQKETNTISPSNKSLIYRLNRFSKVYKMCNIRVTNFVGNFFYNFHIF